MQKQYNQTLFVEVPKDATEVKIAHDLLIVSYSESAPYVTNLPSGEWEIVNPLNEITEEQAINIAEKVEATSDRIFDSKDGIYFKQYKEGGVGCFSGARNSLYSLATHLGFEKDANIIVLQKKN